MALETSLFLMILMVSPGKRFMILRRSNSGDILRMIRMSSPGYRFIIRISSPGNLWIAELNCVQSEISLFSGSFVIDKYGFE